MQVDAILHGEVYAEVVVLVACQTTLARAETNGLHGFQSAEPSEHVDVVDVLLNDMVAREPLPVHPVFDHILAVVPASLTLAIPQHVLVPVDVSSCDLADHALHDFLIRLHVAALVMTLCACHNAKVLGLCLLGCCHDDAVAHGVNADWLL